MMFRREVLHVRQRHDGDAEIARWGSSQMSASMTGSQTKVYGRNEEVSKGSRSISSEGGSFFGILTAPAASHASMVSDPSPGFLPSAHLRYPASYLTMSNSGCSPGLERGQPASLNCSPANGDPTAQFHTALERLSLLITLLTRNCRRRQ